MTVTKTIQEKLGVLDLIPLGECVLDVNFTVLYWNSCLEDWTKISRNEILGHPIGIYFPDLTQPKYTVRFRDIFKGGPPVIFSAQLHPNLIPSRRPDGKWRIQHIIVTPFPALDGAGVYALLSIQDVTDITEQVQKNKALQERAWEKEVLQKQNATLQKQAQLLDLAHDSIMVRDMSGTIIFWNGGASDMYGWTKEEALGKNVRTLLQTQFPKSQEESEVELLRCEHWEGVLAHTARNSQTLTVESRWALQRDIDGEPVAVLQIDRDITHRVQAEQERDKLIEILEATPDFVYSASVDGKLFYLNKAARKILGFGETEEVSNCYIPSLHPQWAYEIISSQGIPAAMRDGSWVGETALLSSDGREIPLSQLIVAHKGPDGSVKMLSTIARDITKQKQIEVAVREAERRWRNMLEKVRLFVVGLDCKGAIEYANPFFLEVVGYAKEEVIGSDWLQTFVPPEHRDPKEETDFLEFLRNAFSTPTHETLITKDGLTRTVAWKNTPQQNLQGDVIGIMSIGEDITERRALERMKDEFISVVSHELRTPLTCIQGSLDLLVSGVADPHPEKKRHLLEIAAGSTKRLIRIVNDILDLERLESGKIKLLKQLVSAADLMQQAAEQIQVMAKGAGVTLCVSSHPLELEADCDRIIQVLTNLLSNAIKFSPAGSTVWLTVEMGNEERGMQSGEKSNQGTAPESVRPTLLFQVKDQGRGIPADKLESIFGRFEQVDVSDSRKKGGTGLGLAICRSIVLLHGGQLWVESVLGEGSTFYFTLPVGAAVC
ncbi:MAG: PAS domain S-box protein [Oscillatoria princeps RMCB-10]|jgi:PAS domain S-box-containing protein|nr:PAS domain S-box protein [Oscillatoria princeps RMCB-10]